MNVRSSLALGLVALPLLVGCAPVHADSSPSHGQAADPTVQAQIEVAVAMMREQGFVMRGGTRTGALADDADERLVLDLRGGRDYMIVGACDDDCSDLDLDLVGPDGESVDSDYELDDVPMVAVPAARGGTYHLTVGMATCSVAPCRYGVAVFARE